MTQVEHIVFVNGLQLRDSLHKPMPSVKHAPRRVVPAFSTQSRQRNTTVAPPPKCFPREPRFTRPSGFETLYKRGDLPIVMRFSELGLTMAWNVDMDKLDFHRYLPVFVNGLRDPRHPFHLFATKGLKDMLHKNNAAKILPCVPEVILPLKYNMDTRDRKVIGSTLLAIQQFAEAGPLIGEALVPYYRQLLPMCNIFINDTVFSRKRLDLKTKIQHIGKVVEETLNILEINGGEDAYINIKYMVPTYASCVYN